MQLQLKEIMNCCSQILNISSQNKKAIGGLENRLIKLNKKVCLLEKKLKTTGKNKPQTEFQKFPGEFLQVSICNRFYEEASNHIKSYDFDYFSTKSAMHRRSSCLRFYLEEYFKIEENRSFYVTEGRRCKGWNGTKFVTIDSAKVFWQQVCSTIDSAYSIVMNNIRRNYRGRQEAHLLEMSYNDRGLQTLKKQDQMSILAPYVRSNREFITGSVE